MTTINKASELAEELVARLATITVADGFNTDIGLKTYRGRRNIEADNAPCVVLIEGLDTVRESGPSQVSLDQAYAVSAYLPCDPDNPNTAAHLAIKDIKRALFKDGSTMAGKVKKISYAGRDIGPRGDGVPVVQAVVHIEIQFAETLADA